MRTVLIAVACLTVGAAGGVGLGYVFFAPAVPKKVLKLDIVDGGVYRVRSVIDGDTIVLENGLHLRYNGINAPETMRWYKDPSPMSLEATARNIELVEGKNIRLRLASDPMDMHGRVVANIFIVPADPSRPEIELRNVMLKEGFAKVMDLGISKDDYKALKAMQEEAKTAQLGIWGIKNEPKPAEEAKPFCAASSSKTYHKSDCYIAKRISPANRHEYATAEDAEAVGLKPCAACLGKKK